MKLEIYYHELNGMFGSELLRKEVTLKLLQQACELALSEEDEDEIELKKPKFKFVKCIAWELNSLGPRERGKVFKNLSTKGYHVEQFEESTIVILNRAKISKQSRKLVQELIYAFV
jgi:DNA modification methylase